MSTIYLLLFATNKPSPCILRASWSLVFSSFPSPCCSRLHKTYRWVAWSTSHSGLWHRSSVRQRARRRVPHSTVVLEQGPLGTGLHGCFRCVHLEARVKGVIPSPLNIIISQCVSPIWHCVCVGGGTDSNCSTNARTKLSPLSLKVGRQELGGLFRCSLFEGT